MNILEIKRRLKLAKGLHMSDIEWLARDTYRELLEDVIAGEKGIKRRAEVALEFEKLRKD